MLNCDADVIITDPSSREKQIICTVRNEGGVEESYDFYPDLLQDAYLDEHPEARKAQAFLDLCASGDVDGILELLFDDGEEDVEGAPVDLLRYQSPLQKGRSPLHIAIMNQQQAVAWLILWLASGAPEYRFPADMLAAASQRGLARDDYNVSGKLDIRNLRDDEGLSAQDMARSVGGVWEVWDLPRDPHHRSREDVESVLTPI
ncbi:MAG: hypothetical protein M4579_002819 [Chaenotheca gracillima]|nr:MAG: hypothetical protein M4579_002819 [Chaenotheca gracillima]